MVNEINFAVAGADQIQTAFKYAGLDEHPKYQGVISSVGMVKALKAEGFRAIQDNKGFLRAVR